MARDLDDVVPSGGSGPLDGTFRNTNIVVLIIFGVCCSLLALIVSLIAYFTAKDSKAKSNALIVLIVSGVITAGTFVLNLTGALVGLGR